MSIRTGLRLVLVNLVIFVALAIALEGTSSLARRVRTFMRGPVDIPPEPYIRHDPDLGWSPRPGAVVTGPGSGASLHVNASGIRSPREIADVPAGRIRVVCSGDSYTFGEGVADAATWCAQLEALDSRLEAVNLGVPGYGVDQAYLRYMRDGPGLHERVHLFAFIDDDLRRFGVRSQKPYLTSAGGRLVRHNVPVPPVEHSTRLGTAFEELNIVQAAVSLGGRLRRARGRPIDGPADGVMEAVIDALAAAGRARQSVQIVVRLPSSYRPSPYAPAFMAYARRSMAVVDLRERFDALPDPEQWGLFFEGLTPGSHFNDAGHAWVARELKPAVAEAIARAGGAPAR
jgi:hypothetical protein